MADLEALTLQLGSQVAGALACPPQRRHGIPSRRRRYHPLQCLHPTLLGDDQRPPTPAWATLAAALSASALQLLAASANRSPRQASRARYYGVASVSNT